MIADQHIVASPAAEGRFDPIYDSQATFRVLLEAMARPGSIARLPALDPRCPLVALRPLSSMLLTLLDHEVSFAVVATNGQVDAGTVLTRYLTSATGSQPTPIDEADFVVALDGVSDALIVSLKRGSLAYPDESATLLVVTPTLTGDDGPPVVLSGPGLAADQAVQFAGLTASNLMALAEANDEPPRGIDLILCDADGTIRCLPRSTRIRVV